ncbi:hypothetical protein AAVH_15985 [Aphelenchoides avenae]|nr:hypothetical protein AAVH_15985 [Aphelenchus avenae]
MHFDSPDHARCFQKGATFVTKGFVNAVEGGAKKISANLENIEGPVQKDDNVPDIRNTTATPKKAKRA